MLKLPTHVQLEITDVCNLRCKYCYHFNTDRMPKSADLDDNKINQLVQKMVDARIYSLVITGGEPLTRPTAVIRAIEAAKKADIFVSINTNLLLLTPDLLTRLKEAGIDSFLVSCSASDPDIYRKITRRGDYGRLCSKIKLLINANMSCMVNMVVTPANHLLVRSTAKDMVRLGIKRFAATPVGLNVEHPDAQEALSEQQIIVLLEDLKWCADNLQLNVDILEPLPKCFLPSWCWEKEYAFTKRVCQAGRLSISVSNIGDVRPCSHNPVIYGNLFDESLEKIWVKMDSYRTESIPVTCKYCPTVASCYGSCRTNSLAVSKLLNRPDRLMVGHIEPVESKQEKLVMEPESIVYFKGSLRWRQENENYSVASKKGGGNVIVVNKEMFHFICWLEECLPLSVEKLVDSTAKDSTLESFFRVLELLVKKEFIYLT